MPLANVKIKDTCLHGGNTGKIMQTQEFANPPGVTWYWVVLPSIHPNVGYWYREDCFDILDANGKSVAAAAKTGLLPKKDKANAYRHKIQKGDDIAYFKVDKVEKDSLIADGYTVTYAP